MEPTSMKKTVWLTRSAMLLAIALIIQSMHLISYITGPIINAILILAVIFVGPLSGVLIGCITPFVAFLTGILPAVAVPLIPVIMIANITLVLVFWGFNRWNAYVAWLVAAAAKFAVFYLAVNFVLEIFGIKLPGPLLAAFQLPQLFTALIGGFAAIIVARSLKRIKKG